MDIPTDVLAAGRRFDIAADQLSPLPGATARTWAAGAHILRLASDELLAVELAASSAAATTVPVPDVLAAAPGAVLLRRLPGVPAGSLDGLDERRAYRRGLACGRLHEALGRLAAPAGVPAVPDSPLPGDRLLHLDLHPFNVLVDEHDEVTGVLDWSNTAAGHEALDRARSASILTGDPAVLAMGDDPRVAAMRAGWADAAGFDALPRAATGWAKRYLLDDLARRYGPAELDASAAALDRR